MAPFQAFPPERRTVLPSIATTPDGTPINNAGDETALELLRVEGGEYVTEVIM